MHILFMSNSQDITRIIEKLDNFGTLTESVIWCEFGKRGKCFH